VVCVDILGGREERRPYKIQRFHNMESVGFFDVLYCKL
jgi:hypothetical protein